MQVCSRGLGTETASAAETRNSLRLFQRAHEGPAESKSLELKDGSAEVHCILDRKITRGDTICGHRRFRFPLVNGGADSELSPDLISFPFQASDRARLWREASRA